MVCVVRWFYCDGYCVMVVEPLLVDYSPTHFYDAVRSKLGSDVCVCVCVCVCV